MKDNQAQKVEEEVPVGNPLIPHGIENFIPSCVVCKGEVPAKRRTSRSKETCGPECYNVLRAYKKHVNQKSKCPNCRHPSTPEERKQFLLWRKAAGQIRHVRGRPPVKREEAVAQALREAIEMIVSLDPNRDVERFKNLIDGKKATGSTLHTSGTSTKGDEHGTLG